MYKESFIKIINTSEMIIQISGEASDFAFF